MPRLMMMMTSIVSEESLARDTHTHTDREIQVSSKLTFDRKVKTLTFLCQPKKVLLMKERPISSSRVKDHKFPV